jgi:hypothetical protein
MLLLHNKLLKKVDICVCSLATALQNPCFDDDYLDDFFVNAEEETASKSLVTIVLSNSSKKIYFFYSQGEVKRLPNEFGVPSHDSFCTCYELVLQEFKHKNTTIEVSCSS